MSAPHKFLSKIIPKNPKNSSLIFDWSLISWIRGFLQFVDFLVFCVHLKKYFITMDAQRALLDELMGSGSPLIKLFFFFGFFFSNLMYCYDYWFYGLSSWRGIKLSLLVLRNLEGNVGVLSISRSIFHTMLPFCNMGFLICNLLFRFLHIYCCHLISFGAFLYYRVAFEISLVRIVFGSNEVT